MKTSHDRTLGILHDLIETCKDGREGFTTAAQDARDPELSRVFSNYAAERARFVAELQQRVSALGGDPDQHGSLGAALHRGWMDLKAALASNEPHAVLSECERGEDAAKANYRDALETFDLDDQTRALVQRQAAAIQEAHDHVKQLRDSVAYAHH
jgi:uncharacterized protein (TIGR02284 family)